MSDTGGDPHDEDETTDELILDDAFVRAATRREPSAAERLIQRKRIEAEQQRLAYIDRREREQRAPVPRRSRGRGRRVLSVLVVGALLVAGYWAYRRPSTSKVAAGGDASTTSSSVGGASTPSSSVADVRPRLNYIGGEPPPGVGEARQPLERPAAAPAASGPYRFLQTQSHSRSPVAYDPCRAIHVVINDRTEPPGGDADVRAALALASHYSGLRFVIDGTTTEAPSLDRAAYLPGRYPGRWAPVLIAWTDPAQIPTLRGTVAGFGGSSAVELEGTQVYVSGLVLLDGPQLAADSDGHAAMRETAEHEIGHLLGLAHVKDPTQIMNPVSTGAVPDYAAGDQRGLEQLGRGRCMPDI